ncbi:hypothetical protein FTUN_1098 [Frigoriglobus tundricola]|uniref:Uncharacterized protein n=1 Tax=Frigoriglobus tundricola TaxID=2774151 RepID=A0A6M5YJV9_9BACT|nr:hypothetical protein FTUN_1098 [Frigoriglobus tundricola]
MRDLVSRPRTGPSVGLWVCRSTWVESIAGLDFAAQRIFSDRL